MSRTRWALYEAQSHMDVRRALWSVLQASLNVDRVSYPGCYVDVSPSFVFLHEDYRKPLDSHADAGIAALDPDWELVGVMRGQRLVETGLDEYFQPKPGRVADREHMIQTQKSIAYTKTASNYLFRRN